MSQTYEVPPIPNTNEGKTVASWVTMGGLFFGLLIIGLGFAMGQDTLMVVGGIVLVVGLLAGAVLRRLGYGQKHHVGSRDDATV